MDTTTYEWFTGQFPEYKSLFEFVSPSEKQEGYYRLISISRIDTSKAQLLAMLEFALAGYETYGKKGLGELHGEVMPHSAVAVHRRMKGKKYGEKLRISEQYLKKIEGRIEVLRVKTLTPKERREYKKKKREEKFRETMRGLREGLMGIAQVVAEEEA